MGGRKDHQERGGPAGGCEGRGLGAAWGCVPCWVLLGVVFPVGSVWDLLACPAGGSSARDCLPWVGVGRVRGVTAGQGHLKALGHQEPFLLLSVSLFSRCCICWGQRQKLTWKRSQR